MPYRQQNTVKVLVQINKVWRILLKKNKTNKVTQDKRIAKCNYKLPSIILSNYLFLVLLITITTKNI